MIKMGKTPTAFISYSWDNDEQKEWVTYLVNLLRHNGVDATSDVFETQGGTVNLNAMMVKNIMDNDYIIVVLTETYAERADLLKGGVGFETSMLISYIQENLRKIIPIMNCKWNTKKKVPFYLTGVHYIDLSESDHFEEKFKELLHRIYHVDLVKKAPLGNRPDLAPRQTSVVIPKGSDDPSDIIPNFRQITDMNRNKFIRESFLAIKEGFLQLVQATKQNNQNFDFDYEDITNRKTIYKMYINGHQKYAVKIWLDGSFGSAMDAINVAYGNHVSISDNSMNEIIVCEIGKDKKLTLRMTLNILGNKEASTPRLIVRELWNNILMWLN